MDGSSCSVDGDDSSSASSCITTYSSSGKSTKSWSPSSSPKIHEEVESLRSSYDATELKARLILHMAKRETEERMRSRGWISLATEVAAMPPPPRLTAAAAPGQSLGQVGSLGLFSMKRSLELFLRRRKTKNEASLEHPCKKRQHESV